MEKFFLVSAPAEENVPVFEVSLAGITYPDPDYGVFRKCSDTYVVEYVLSGEGTVIFGGSEYHPKKGDAYILPKGKEHRYYSSPKSPWEKKWMNVSGTLCESLISAYGISDCVYFPNCSVGTLFDDFFDFCGRNTDIDRINEYGAVIFHRIVQRLVFSADKVSNNIAMETKRYIDGNIYGKLSAEAVAKRACLSVSQLGRLFKAEYGMTVYAYILKRKIETAENLLRNTSLSVGEIADTLSFTDEHYFSNIFKKKSRMTPCEYRREATVKR